MDSAEIWLLQNDPDYAETSQGWKHLNGEHYNLPREENHDEAKSIEDLLEAGHRAVHGVPTRACEHCGTAFEAERRDGNKQRFCTERCRKRAENRRRKRRGANA